MQLLPILRATPAPDAGAGVWQRRGQQVRNPTPGQNAKRGVFGALNLRTGAWFYPLAAHKRSADFIAFLGLLAAAYPTGLIYVLVDNASLHTSQAVQPWRAAQGRVVLLYLPTDSGHPCTCAASAGVVSIPSRRSGGRSRARPRTCVVGRCRG